MKGWSVRATVSALALLVATAANAAARRPDSVGPGPPVDEPGRASADAARRDGGGVAGRRRRGHGAARPRHRRPLPQHRAARARLRQHDRCGDRLRQPAPGDGLVRARRRRRRVHLRQRRDLRSEAAARSRPARRHARHRRRGVAEVDVRPRDHQGRQRLGGREDEEPHSLDHRQRRRRHQPDHPERAPFQVGLGDGVREVEHAAGDLPGARRPAGRSADDAGQGHHARSVPTRSSRPSTCATGRAAFRW